jgi:hypothetical protein
MRLPLALCLAAPLVAPVAAPLAAQAQPQPPAWDVTQPRGKTSTIDFTVEEGTWMSVDQSPDG